MNKLVNNLIKFMFQILSELELILQSLYLFSEEGITFLQIWVLFLKGCYFLSKLAYL